jgi:hypothetical protein
MPAPIPLIYIAGKYTAAHPYLVDRNIQYAKLFAQEIAIRGGFPVTPHLCTGHFDGIQTYQFWIASTLELMYACKAVFLLPNYLDSSGARGEEKEAVKLGMKVFYPPSVRLDSAPTAEDFVEFEAWMEGRR